MADEIRYYKAPEAKAAPQAAPAPLTVLPEGTRAAVVAVKGVGEKLADEVVDAINAYLANPTQAE